MKKIIFYLFCTITLLPIVSNAIGLGDMEVHSYLNQPFSADIQLSDIGNTPVSDIQVNVASPKDFERVGLERSYSLDELRFKVKTRKGKSFIAIHSVQPISEPYFELLIDLSWDSGQIYRAYTVLLDPPAYELAHRVNSSPAIEKKQSISSANTRAPGVIEKTVISHKPAIQDDVKGQSLSDETLKPALIYGPTHASETIWQIAQRYKSADTNLQQMILAIAAANPAAFSKGNINGLKKGVKLKIPPQDVVRKIPAKLAKKEVYQHDIAWQKNKPINHVLSQPYGEGPEADKDVADIVKTYESVLQPVPTFLTTQSELPLFSTFIPKIMTFFKVEQATMPRPTDSKTNQLLSDEAHGLMASDTVIIATALETVKSANSLLIEQLQRMQVENKRLQALLLKKDQLLQKLTAQILDLTARQGLAEQTSSSSESQRPLIWPWIVLLALMLASGVCIYWWVWGRHGAEKTDHEASSPGKDNEVQEAVIKTKEDEKKTEQAHPVKSKIHGAIVTETKIKKQPLQPAHVEPSELEEKNEKNRESEPADKHDESEPHSAQEKDLSEPPVQAEDDIKPSPSSQDSQKDTPVEPGPEPEREARKDDDISASAQNTEEEHVIEFEPGLTSQDNISSDIANVQSESTQPSKHEDDNLLEFETTAIKPDKQSEPSKSLPADETVNELERELEDNQEQDINDDKTNVQAEDSNPVSKETPVEEDVEAETIKPVKSTRALQTLLDLAQTYISMEDYEAARQSLEEVLGHGNDEQKKNAQAMLDELDKL